MEAFIFWKFTTNVQLNRASTFFKKCYMQTNDSAQTGKHNKKAGTGGVL